MSALKAAGSSVVSGDNAAAGDNKPAGLSMFQKIKLEVALAKKYDGNVDRIPASKLQEMYQQKPGKLLAKMNEELGLNFESMEQTARKKKARRLRGGTTSHAGDDPYKLRSIMRRRASICKDAETGEKLTIVEKPPEDIAHQGRRIDNLLWRERELMEVKEALNHPESTNKTVLGRALEIYRADPDNAVPQPMSSTSKHEKKGRVYAMLQTLRRTHAQQLYELVLEEEERDKKRLQLMDWAKGDLNKIQIEPGMRDHAPDREARGHRGPRRSDRRRVRAARRGRCCCQ